MHTRAHDEPRKRTQAGDRPYQRKELRGELETLRRAVVGHRTDLARIKREKAALEQEVRRLRRDMERMPTESVSAVEEPAFRYSPKRLASGRSKLGLSAADFGLLVGASALSIYKWERGTKPRQKFMPALANTLAMGKREVVRRLEELKSTG